MVPLLLSLCLAADGPIKTVQPKAYLKMNRVELTPAAQFVVNDPYLRRRLLDLRMDWHLTEVFALEADLAWAPDLGEADLRPLAQQIIYNNHVSPDISRLTRVGMVGLSLAPVHGKTAVRLAGKSGLVHFDLYGSLLLGKVQTTDDLSVIGDGPEELATAVQWHDLTSVGGGIRISLGGPMALRLEMRSLQYIEVLGSKTLEMKGNLVMGLGVSWFSPQTVSTTLPSTARRSSSS